MRQSTPISYLNFRQQFFFSQCRRLAVMMLDGEEMKKNYLSQKSSTRAEIITLKLAIFLFMIKYEFEMSASRNSSPSSLCLYLFRVFSILAVFTFIQGLKNSWIFNGFIYCFIPGCSLATEGEIFIIFFHLIVLNSIHRYVDWDIDPNWSI